MKLSESFAGKVEALVQPDKFSIRHLDLIAKSLGLRSIDKLMPNGIQEYDMIEILHEKASKFNKNCSESEQFEERIVEIREVKSSNNK